MWKPETMYWGIEILVPIYTDQMWIEDIMVLQ